MTPPILRLFQSHFNCSASFDFPCKRQHQFVAPENVPWGFGPGPRGVRTSARGALPWRVPPTHGVSVRASGPLLPSADRSRPLSQICACVCLSVLLINFVLFWFIIVHRLYRYVIDFLVCLYSPVVLNLLSPVWVF